MNHKWEFVQAWIFDLAPTPGSLQVKVKCSVCQIESMIEAQYWIRDELNDVLPTYPTECEDNLVRLIMEE